ncbi:hypothetical protein RBA71_08180 [Brenneria goodwinii]|uniref:hypothetical protein n=1 Tax=Brenneria goodwinii TaxID=1109412 RepID=UPI0036E651DF
MNNLQQRRRRPIISNMPHISGQPLPARQNNIRNLPPLGEIRPYAAGRYTHLSEVIANLKIAEQEGKNKERIQEREADAGSKKEATKASVLLQPHVSPLLNQLRILWRKTWLN